MGDDLIVKMDATSISESSSKESTKTQENEIHDTKWRIRNSVWRNLQDTSSLEAYPTSCFNKIPYFLGAATTANKVKQLKEFKLAKTIKVNPSLAQMLLRSKVLMSGKTLLVPCPSLEEDFFYLLNKERLNVPWSKAKRAMTKKGAKTLGEPLFDDWTQVPIVDLFVVGSVAVSVDGTRLGKGCGYAELEWAILCKLGKVTEDTKVLTTVHDRQLVSELSASCSCEFDLPVDIIVTPTRTIRVRNGQPKPTCGILWDKVSPEDLESIPILKKFTQ